MAKGSEAPLLPGFARHVAERGWLSDGDRVIVACSGGLDSMVLLHLLHFEREALPDLRLHVAHFDHRMRAESGAHAEAVAQLAEEWGIPATIGRAETDIRGETEAREARYHFLETLHESLGARWIVTGHHADDQVETILFRIFRGTGLRGLTGMPESREPGILRPLLPFRREALEAYARDVDLPVFIDTTNLDPRFARNVIRHELIPRAREGVAPGIEAAVLRLGRLARESEKGWESVLPRLRDEVVVTRSEARVVLDRNAFLATHPFIQVRILRSLLEPLGSTPGEAGTRAALEFTRTATSGHRWRLSGDVILARDFDRLVLRKQDPDRDSRGSAPAGSAAPKGSADAPLPLPDSKSGVRLFRVGGRPLIVRWGPEAPPGALWVEPFPPSRLRFPLYLRGWLPGDRMRLPGGSRTLKKLLTEARIPVDERRRIPILVDAAGEVLWIPGVAKSERARSAHANAPANENLESASMAAMSAETPLFIGIETGSEAGTERETEAGKHDAEHP